MNIAIIDIVFGIILLFTAVRCLMSGFIREFFSKAALLFGAFAGILFYGLLTPYLLPYVNFLLLANIAAFLIIFIIVYLAIRIVEKIVGIAFKGEIMGGLDKALGLLLGVFEGLLIITFILIVITGQQFFNPAKILHNSYFFKFLAPFLNMPKQMLQGLTAFNV